MTKNQDVNEFEFRGQTFEIDPSALNSALVLMDLTLIGKDPEHGFAALDAVLCGKLREDLARIPEVDGSVSKHGASNEAFAAFTEALMLQTAAKN